MTPVIATDTRRMPYSLSDDLVESAETQTVTYRCPDGHTFPVRFYAEAEVVPRRWDCRICGAVAHTDDEVAEDVPVAGRVVGSRKTPWQQLRERRTIAELEALLDERLQLLRTGVATAAVA
jgi:hypothetical protein